MGHSILLSVFAAALCQSAIALSDDKNQDLLDQCSSADNACMASRLLPTIMRAVRVHKFGAPEVLSIEEKVPVPKPADNQVLIKVHSAGVNPVDTYVRQGAYAALPSLPYTPGKDAAGVVEDVGGKVTRLKKGDRVYNIFASSGTYAEYAIADDSQTYRLHDALSYEQGAALGVPYFTAYRALVVKGRARAGQSVLVHGASGAVGLAAVQIARVLGLTVYGTAGTTDGLDLVKQNGATGAYNHRDSGYLKDIQAATGGKGVDLIIEMLADVNLVKDFDVLAYAGTVVVVGNRGSLDFNPRLLMGKEASVCGVGLPHATPADLAQTAAFLWSGQAVGWLRPVIGQRYPLDKVKDAHEEVIGHSGGSRGKIVLNL